ncbi:hypothetical protein R5R35_002907 [Gryllus longicercus]|uniref:Putative treble-clef zinc-finger domain-containing protein n=1 Tax=Gryllus longicercus TaxID=2509291 RepID=A0AAN9VVD7_9ORTH
MANDRLKALLSDLGRATLRGVRKCPKCGTYNGTRGLSCKNKACDVVFKEAGERRKLSTEACKLLTGNTTQVFSVRVRDKGPDYRGFVQLPVVQNGIDGEHFLDSDMNLITQTSALCFVDTCQRSFDTSVLKCHEKTTPSGGTTCQHIQAALRCYTEAQPLSLKRSVLSSFNASDDIKQAIWQLANETTGPLVQRVSKNIMAVKCKASPKHPLGYLHFSFFMSKLRDRIENKYFCSCTAFKGQVKHATNKEDPNFKKCVHFYACVCAFASDPKLSEEFAYYINLDKPVFISTHMVPVTTVPNEHQLVAILSEEGTPCEVEVEVLPEDAALLDATSLTVSDSGIAQVHGLEMMTGDPVEVQIQTMQTDGLSFAETSVLTDPSSSIEMLSMKRKREDQASSALLTLQETGSLSKRPNGGNNMNHLICSSSNSGVIGKKAPIGSESVDETTTNFSFLQWLASVTERINQTMHFQFSGKPEPLVFHIPQDFFDCLRERISCKGKRKRLPNNTTAFIRKDAVPMGTFTKYTWQITNIIHVKHIFETPLMPLEITRSFVENRDGTYEPYEHEKDENETYRKTGSQPLIKPLELKTFLKVGNTSPDQVEPTPFLIEWIPDILPRSKIGELKIRFEFGHQRNGQVDKRATLSRNILKLESHQPNDDISVVQENSTEMITL